MSENDGKATNFCEVWATQDPVRRLQAFRVICSLLIVCHILTKRSSNGALSETITLRRKGGPKTKKHVNMNPLKV